MGPSALAKNINEINGFFDLSSQAQYPSIVPLARQVGHAHRWPNGEISAQNGSAFRAFAITLGAMEWR
jgi:hypothetical protein